MQVEQALPHCSLQQTPSAQNCEAQSAPLRQAAPVAQVLDAAQEGAPESGVFPASGISEFGSRHFPKRHTKPSGQSAVVVQLASCTGVTQLLSSSTKGRVMRQEQRAEPIAAIERGMARRRLFFLKVESKKSATAQCSGCRTQWCTHRRDEFRLWSSKHSEKCHSDAAWAEWWCGW